MDEEAQRKAVRDLIAFLNGWRERHDLRNSEARAIIAAAVAEQFPEAKK